VSAVLRGHAQTIEVAYGRDHPADGIDWGDRRMMTRDEAARALRDARADQFATRRDGSRVRLPFPVIALSMRGYSIYVGPNPAWRYAA